MAQSSNTHLSLESIRQSVPQVCGGNEIGNGLDVELVRRVIHRLGAVPDVSNDSKHWFYVAPTNSTVINAWTVHLTPTDSLICLPLAMVDFMSRGEGEVAFIVAHEIGHAVDDSCLNYAKFPNSAAKGAVLGALLGGGRGAAAGAALSKQGCESRADEIGFRILIAAGYNPVDAAGAFGRIEMYLGDTGGVFAKLAALGSDHPMTPDRIKHMRLLLTNRQ